MTDVLVEVDAGDVTALPVSPTSVDVTLLTGDCRIIGWSLRSTVNGTVPGTEDGAEAAIVAATAGNVSLPHATDSLTGFAVELTTAGTAAMTITVSNVVGGPFTYVVAVGVTSFVINFPTALLSTGVAPNVAWSATAAAVGEMNIFGATAQGGGTGVQTVVEIQDVGNILGEISLAPTQAETDQLRDAGVPCQGQIKLHVISGTVTGVVYAYVSRGYGRGG